MGFFANYQKHLNLGNGHKYAEVFFLLLPWEVRSVEIQIVDGLDNAVFCRRPKLFCGSRTDITVIYGVNFWDDVLEAVTAMAEYLLTSGGQDFTCPSLITT